MHIKVKIDMIKYKDPSLSTGLLVIGMLWVPLKFEFKEGSS